MHFNWTLAVVVQSVFPRVQLPSVSVVACAGGDRSYRCNMLRCNCVMLVSVDTGARAGPDLTVKLHGEFQKWQILGLKQFGEVEQQ